MSNPELILFKYECKACERFFVVSGGVMYCPLCGKYLVNKIETDDEFFIVRNLVLVKEVHVDYHKGV